MSPPKAKAPAPALQSMTKPELAKINRELKDLRETSDDAGMALASAYKKIKKRGINLEAFKLAEKLNRLDSPAKIQSFLVDFDRLRQLHGWDDQQNLFEADKTAPQKEAEKANGKEHSPPPAGRAAKNAAAKSAKLAVISAKRVNKVSEKAVAKKGGKTTRAALFSEDADGDDAPVH